MKLNFWQIMGLVLLVGGLVALMVVKNRPAVPDEAEVAPVASQPV